MNAAQKSLQVEAAVIKFTRRRLVYMIILWSRQLPAIFQSFYMADVRPLVIQSGDGFRMKLMNCERAGAVKFKITKVMRYELL